ncbi:GHKL domain-containing protein [Clostridium butyricum]|uniref:histidine kinase n=1 Tax=Clostridium butyricum TaxID=1492 RepID=A0A6L9ELT4_CLOBU|nr:GHKL domain-containing protein [Clostridium butyricum]
MIKTLKEKKYNLIFGVIIGFVLAQIILAEGYAILVSRQQEIAFMSTDLMKSFNNPLKILSGIIFIFTVILFNTKKFIKFNLDRIGSYLILVVLVSITVAFEVTFIVFLVGIKMFPNWQYYMENNYFISINIFYIICFIGVSVFLITFILLVNIKVRYIKYLTKEVQVIKNEGFGKTIDVRGGDELSELCKSINNMSLELGKKIENEKNIENNKNELITNISHDLKTPLTSIIGYLELLNSNGINENDKEKYISIAYKKSLRLKELVNELFEYTKLSGSDIKLVKDKVNISTLLNQAVGESIINFSEKNIEVFLNNPYSEIFCEADSTQILRVFENLIKNAEKYSNSDSVFKVTVAVNNKNVLISLSNKCKEIMEKDLENIFEKFYRNDKSRSEEGSGLGLPIAKRIIELHNGRLWAEKTGDNVKFNIQLQSIA